MKAWIEAFSIIDYISVGILLTAVTLNAFKSIESYVKAYTINSWLLSSLIAVVAILAGETHLYIAAFLTLATKGILIPIFLRRIVRQMRVTHEVQPYISNALSLAISGILVAVVYASLKDGIFVTGFSTERAPDLHRRDPDQPVHHDHEEKGPDAGAGAAVHGERALSRGLFTDLRHADHDRARRAVRHAHGRDHPGDLRHPDQASLCLGGPG